MAGALLLLLFRAAPAGAQVDRARALDDPREAPASAASVRRDATIDRLSRAGRLGRPGVRLRAPRTSEPPAPSEAARAWPGPQIQLGYAFYRLSDGHGGGDVHAGSVALFLQLPVPELRLGLLGELGARDYSLGGDDLIARASVHVGMQLVGWLDPFVPHVVALASVGGVVGERFETTVAHAFAGGGIGLGVELRMYRNLHGGLELSYQRLEMDGAAYDVFMLRFSLGL